MQEESRKFQRIAQMGKGTVYFFPGTLIVSRIFLDDGEGSGSSLFKGYLQIWLTFLGESWIFEEIGCGKVGVEKRYIRRPSWTRGPKHPKSPLVVWCFTRIQQSRLAQYQPSIQPLPSYRQPLEDLTTQTLSSNHRLISDFYLAHPQTNYTSPKLVWFSHLYLASSTSSSSSLKQPSQLWKGPQYCSSYLVK